MHINNYDITPPQEVLDQCHQVVIADPTTVMWRMKKWCREHELSLLWSELVDTSDVDYNYDHVAEFYFINPADATAFTLKFK
jgi:hypothetical protein